MYLPGLNAMSPQYSPLLNSQPMGFYSPSQLVQDARRHGVSIRPVDVTKAMGLYYRIDRQKSGLVSWFQSSQASQPGWRLTLTDARAHQPFANLEDLAHRARLDKGDLQALADADALSLCSIATAVRRHGRPEALRSHPRFPSPRIKRRYPCCVRTPNRSVPITPVPV